MKENIKKLIRVFPRKTKATPIDALAFYDVPPLLFLPPADEVHVSCTFTWDKPKAEYLADQWNITGLPVKIGGVAYNSDSGIFVAGKYLRQGYTITSRGCPNRCWFCNVWKRNPDLIELPIVDGFNILDDNLLACSEKHIKSVFDMLQKQKQKAEFTGGIEAARLKEWHVELFQKIKPKQIFFAYDTETDYEPLVIASKMLREAGFTRNILRCYLLIGYRGDTFTKAEERLMRVLQLGFYPFAMMYRDDKNVVTHDWKEFQRMWARPALIYAIQKNMR